ncbi:poly-gamma-glutamate biosynthesis protein PgsC/CapC [Halopenitus persicus]|uniref:Capsule biosynthesis CapC n=1 Tax=Halopenitus persicus TaxID=1048396 RepID=A0A1H3GF93_9EURY|nr:poly-gamma-glutamate biosynthesis protein PgsC/CapC [Halopenitus persicus]SDY00969.1 Capsule biosynthesis CapC [Halopenitus persicus]
MIVAVTVTALGVLAVGVITQLFGYRTGGTIAIPVLAVYTLKNALMLPIFLLSTCLAYLGLSVVKRRTLIYGRDELLVAMAIGSGVPLVLLLAIWSVLPESLRSVVFIGSILPGLAAYNYHQIKSQYRKWDLLTTAGLLVGLIAVGWSLVSPSLVGTLGTATEPVLYSATADVAVYKNAVVAEQLDRTILARPIAVVVFLIGVVLSERIRSRYGIRTGLVAMALLAIYALANTWLLVLYLAVLLVAYLGLKTVHYVTLLYGRVLISVATATALVAVVPLALSLPITRGLSAYFVAILAGVNAYSWHVTAPAQRVLFVPLQIGAFLLLLVTTQLISLIRPTLIPRVFGVPAIIAMVVGTVLCVAVVEHRTVDLPDRESVFEASILSGGDEA